MNYYERHIGDYLKDTAHLSLLEHGVYGRLLDVYYTRECGIGETEAARLVGAKSKEERAALESVLAEFFTRAEGTWTHGRCDAEIERYRDKQRKASASANARWQGTKSHTERNANAMRTHSEGNAPNHQTPDTIKDKQATLASDRPPADPPPLALVERTKAPPDCPHAQVLALWAEMLPHLPQHDPGQWRGTRADHLRARWRETATAKGWQSQEQGLTYLRKLFGYVGQSPFLIGQDHAKDRRPFFAELAWLVQPLNWAKVHEGKYHQTEKTA